MKFVSVGTKGEYGVRAVFFSLLRGGLSAEFTPWGRISCVQKQPPTVTWVAEATESKQQIQRHVGPLATLLSTAPVQGRSKCNLSQRRVCPGVLQESEEDDALGRNMGALLVSFPSSPSSHTWMTVVHCTDVGERYDVGYMRVDRRLSRSLVESDV